MQTLKFNLLSPREREVTRSVADAIVDDKPIKTICEDLKISPDTLEVHLRNIRKKLEVNTTATVIVHFLKYVNFNLNQNNEKRV